MNADTEGSAKTRIQLISQLYHSPQIIRTGLIWYYTFGKADLQAQNIVAVCLNHTLHFFHIIKSRIEILTKLRIQLSATIHGKETLYPHLRLSNHGFVKCFISGSSRTSGIHCRSGALGNHHVRMDADGTSLMEQMGMKIDQSRSYQLSGCINDAVRIALCCFSL